MSSSFRKLAPRREHKERSQPASRTRFGLLEKKKDYILRARDYQSKRKRVMALREKARLRNPDEYYFAMNSSTTKDGIHQASRNDINWTPDMVALMKSQDLSYITTVKTINRKKLEKLNETYPHLLSAKESGSPQYIKFDTNPLEQSKEPVVREPTVHIGFAKTKRAQKEQQKIMREVETRQKAAEKLAMVEKKLIHQKLLTGKGKRVKTKKDTNGNAVYKWKPERKK